MKKVFSVFLVIVVLVLCFCIPVSASSPLVFDPPYLNSDPTALCFSPVSSTQSLYVPHELWEDYLLQGEGELYLPLYVMCLNSSLTLLNPATHNITVSIGLYWSGYLFGTITNSNDNLNIPISSLEYVDHHDIYHYDLQFTISYSLASFCSIIPLNSAEPDVGYYQGIDSLNYQYNSVVGYSSGYSDGYEAGLVASQSNQQQIGYNRGYSVGYEDGRASVDMTDQFHQISDATLLVVSAPFQAINNALNFSVFGVNIASLFAILITLLIVGFIIKKFI